MAVAYREAGLPLRDALGLLPAGIFLLAGGLFGISGGRDLQADSVMAFKDDPSRLIVYGSAYLLAALWLSRRLSDARRVAVGLWPWCLLIGYALLSMSWSEYPGKVLVNCGHYVGGTLVALAAALAVRGRDRWLCVLIAVMLGIVMASSLVAVNIGWPGSIDFDTGRWAGTAGNANTLGFMAAIATGSSVLLLLTARAWVPRLLWIAMSLLAIVLLRGSGSVTSLAVALILSCGALWMLVGRSPAVTGIGRRIASGVGLAVLVVVVVMLVAPQILRVEFGLETIGRTSTLSGRTEIWHFAWGVFKERPVLGYSFDSLASVLSRSGLTVGQFHNGYIDLLVRGGLIAAGLYLIMLLRGLWLTIQQATRTREAVFWFLLLIAHAVFEVTESSIARSVHVFWFLILVANAATFSSIRSAVSVNESRNATGYARAACSPALPNLLR